MISFFKKILDSKNEEVIDATKRNFLLGGIGLTAGTALAVISKNEPNSVVNVPFENLQSIGIQISDWTNQIKNWFEPICTFIKNEDLQEEDAKNLKKYFDLLPNDFLRTDIWVFVTAYRRTENAVRFHKHAYKDMLRIFAQYSEEFNTEYQKLSFEEKWNWHLSSQFYELISKKKSLT